MAETEKKCLCGCGETPVGGRFKPGHDAKLFSLYGDWKKGNYDARLNREQLDFLQESGRVKAEIRYT